MTGPYRRAIARGHLSHAAAIYGRRQRIYIPLASGTLWLIVLILGTHLITQLLP